MSPMVDGPLKYVGSLENEDLRLDHVTKFGRSFSIICVPYTFKLLVQELQAMNVQMRIITEDNIDQMENMSYSQNIKQLTGKNTTGDLLKSIREIMVEKQQKRILTPSLDDFTPDSPNYNPTSPDYAEMSPKYGPNATSYDPNSPPYSAVLGRVMTKEEFDAAQNDPTSPLYDPNTPPYAPGSPAYAPGTPPYPPGTSPQYAPGSPEYAPGTPVSSLGEGHTSEEFNTPESPAWIPHSPDYPPPGNSPQEGGGSRYNVGERVCLRNCKDNYPTRPWKVSHVGGKFITVSAVDKSGLDENEAMNVVTPFDIYPEEQAHIQYPNIPMTAPSQLVQQPNAIFPQQQPTVIIAPKFFNGNGSDNSTDAKAGSDAIPIDNYLNSTESPGIVVKNNMKEAQSISDKPKNMDIDFSNIVIKKAGQ